MFSQRGTLSCERERSSSVTSAASVASDVSREPRRYDQMNLETLIHEAYNIDISAFDRTRLFNPRKQRSCHKRAEPVSEEHRKKESSKNSREYTKRNRDEIATCQALSNEMNAVKERFKELIAELNPDAIQCVVKTFVHDLEEILSQHIDVGSNVRMSFNIPDPQLFYKEYFENARLAMLFEHRPNTPNHYKEKWIELKDQFEKLTNHKNCLNSSRDKTNFASSKSRLNQRIVRERLKSNCWECWREINTMIVQGEDLQNCRDQLKRDIWNNVLAVYYNIYKMMISQKTRYEAEKVERIVEYFTPYSRQSGDLSIEWKPRETPAEIVPKIEIGECTDTTLNPPLPYSTFPQSTDTRTETDQSLQRPQSIDFSRILSPGLKKKLEIQDRLVSTTQFTPTSLPSPPFTLTLPTVPVSLIPVSLVSETKYAQNGEVEENNKESNLETDNVSRKRCNTTACDETEAKKPTAESTQKAYLEPKKEVEEQLFPILNQHALMTISTPTSSKIPVSASEITPIPFFNPLLTAAAGDVTPFEALTPSFFKAIEQQRVMAAFLNHAFQKVQK